MSITAPRSGNNAAPPVPGSPSISFTCPGVIPNPTEEFPEHYAA